MLRSVSIKLHLYKGGSKTSITVEFWSSQQHCFSLFQARPVWTIEKGCARRAGSGKERVVTFLLFPPRPRSTRGIGPLWILTRSSPDFFVYTFSFTSALTSVSADDRDAKVREWGVQGLYFLSRVFHSKKLKSRFEIFIRKFPDKWNNFCGKDDNLARPPKCLKTSYRDFLFYLSFFSELP